MQQRRWATLSIGMVLATVLSLTTALPAVAQTSRPPTFTVERTVAQDAQGNTVITERTFRNDVLVSVEVRVITPQGQLVRRERETFISGQLVTREAVTVSGGMTTTVDRTFVDDRVVVERRQVTDAQGRVVSRMEVTFDPATGAIVQVQERSVTTRNGQRIVTEREFEAVNGVMTEVRRTVVTVAEIGGQRVLIRQEFEDRNGTLTLVREERKVLQGNQGPGGDGDDDDDDDGDDDDDDDRSGSNKGRG